MSLIDQIQYLFLLIKIQASTAFKLLLGLWGIHFCNFLTNYYFNRFGIWPRRMRGLPGIFFCHFLHANFNHLFFNSIPLFILMLLLLTKGTLFFLWISLKIIIISGGFIWLCGRNAIHLGASAMIMGYWGFLFTLTAEHPDFISIILMIM